MSDMALVGSGADWIAGDAGKWRLQTIEKSIKNHRISPAFIPLCNVNVFSSSSVKNKYLAAIGILSIN